MFRDLQFGFRVIRKTPLFTVGAAATLALGIGANSAVFSIVNAVLLRPFGIERPGRLVFIQETSRNGSPNRLAVSAATYLEWKQRARSFSGISAAIFVPFTYAESGGAVRIGGSGVSSDFFDTLGVKPVIGRTFHSSDDAPGADNVVIVSDALWARVFGRDPAVLGKPVRLNSRSYTIVGVVPGAANLVRAQGDLWKPLALPAGEPRDRRQRGYVVVARLKDGVSLQAARAEMEGISKALELQYPATHAGRKAELIDFTTGMVDGARRLLIVLACVAGLVLLIACVNLASLFAARMKARRKEIATRLAFGASGSRIIRQLLIESLLLAILGGCAGMLLARWTLPVLLSLAPLPSRLDDAAVNASTLIYTLGLSLVAALLFGLSPALLAARADVNGVLNDGGRGPSPANRYPFRNALMVAEVALSMVLLVSAVLLVRSFLSLRVVEPGFNSAHVLVNTLLVLSADKYDTNEKRQAFFNGLLDRTRALPGVVSAGGIAFLPLRKKNEWIGYRIAGQTSGEPGRELAAARNVVTEGYFETMGIPLRAGRSFTRRDDNAAPVVAIVNRALADRAFQGRNPVGAHLLVTGSTGPVEIVGVVGNTRQFTLNSDPSPEIFTPFRQSTAAFMYVVARAADRPESVAEPIRREVAALDPDQPVGHRTLDQQIRNAMAQPRMLAALAGVLAALALILAVAGVYGITSFIVAERSREISIRVALGATPRSVVGMVLRGAGMLMAGGIVIGALASIAVARGIASLLFGVGAFDPGTFIGVAALLAAAAMLATFLPARRVARLDGTTTIRPG